jgi:3D (Asp-Asp-Asp) domain-containing protein
VLAARSLDEVTTRLEGLEAVAGQDRALVRATAAARVRLARVHRALGRREARLAAVTAAVEVRASARARALAERRTWLDRLQTERRLSDARVAALEGRVAAARGRAAEIMSAAAHEPAPAAATPDAAHAAAPDVTGPRLLTVTATAYSLTGRTATGLPLAIGVVAVDPSVIPLGTRMTIPGYGEAVAADTGGAIRGAVIDVWLPTEAQARAWGRRAVTVTLH